MANVYTSCIFQERRSNTQSTDMRPPHFEVCSCMQVAGQWSSATLSFREGGCVWVGWGAQGLPTSRLALACWWPASGVRQPCAQRKLFPRGIWCSTKRYWASCCKDFKIHELPNHRSACSVAASYKPPMLVTRVRLPACAFVGCAFIL